MRPSPLVPLLLGLACGFGACTAAPPVRLESGALDLMLEVRQSVGAGSLFAQRQGLTLRGRRTRPVDRAGHNPTGHSPTGHSPTGDETGDRAAGPDPGRPIAYALRPSGEFLLTIGDESGSASRGFDGAEAWIRDGRGVVRHVSLGSRDRLVADGWLRGLLWLTPGIERFQVEVNEATSNDDTIALDLRLSDSPLEASVIIDRASRRPRSYSIRSGTRVREVRFGDWREVIGGAEFPHRVEESVNGRPQHVDTFESSALGTPRTFSPPRSEATDASYQASGTDVLQSRVDSGGRYYVETHLGEDATGWMLLDTGFGSHGIDGAFADAAGVPTLGEAELSGVGGATTTRWRNVKNIKIGPLTLARPRFVEIDTEILTTRAGFPVAGILGSPFFERAVVTLDDRRGTVQISDPNGRREPGLPWQELVIDGTAPCVRGRIAADGRETPPLWFRLDTGSDDTVTVSRWAVSRHSLTGDRSGHRTMRLVGVSGTVLGFRRTVDALVVAGSRLTGAEVTLLQEAPVGPLSDPWIAGNLGTRALEGHRVVIDVPRRRIALLR